MAWFLAFCFIILFTGVSAECDLSDYIPYINATQNADMGVYNLTTTQLNTTLLCLNNNCIWDFSALNNSFNYSMINYSLFSGAWNYTDEYIYPRSPIQNVGIDTETPEYDFSIGNNAWNTDTSSGLHSLGGIPGRFEGFGIYGYYFRLGINITDSTQGYHPLGIQKISTTTGKATIMLMGADDEGSADGVPSHIENGQRISAIYTIGYGATNYNLNANARFMVMAEADFTDSSHPTAFRFDTAPIGSRNGVERMRINNQGYVGIGDTSPDYPLDIEGNVSDITIYSEGGISASHFVDRTEFPTNYDAVSSIKNIKGDIDGKLNHNTLSDFTSKEIKIPIYETITKCYKEPFYNNTAKEVQEIRVCEELNTPNIIGYNITYGRIVNNAVTENTIALQQLIERVEQLERESVKP